jgi:tRNA-Thr(GGU) m(6)t(6)A37 methyltransferase TsaA
MNFKSIGIIHTTFGQPEGTPIQPAYAGGSEGRIEVLPEYAPGLKDLEGFDRIWLLFWCDRAAASQLIVTPYKDTQPRGVFSTRAPSRPNPIGMSAVRLQRVEGNILHVSELDVLDNTPLLDIKPYVPAFDHLAAERTGWLGAVISERSVADNRFEQAVKAR